MDRIKYSPLAFCETLSRPWAKKHVIPRSLRQQSALFSRAHVARMTYGCKDSSDAGLLCLFTSEGVGKRSPFPYHRCVLRQTLSIIFRMIRFLLYHLSLLLLLLLVACQPQLDTLLPETTLTVVVAAESTLSEDAYPLSITVRTNNDYRTRFITSRTM